MPQALPPFPIAHVEPYDRRRIEFAHAVLENSRRLLQRPAPNSFLGGRNNDLIPLPDEAQQHNATEVRRYRRLAAECRELAVILLDQREAYLKMAATYDAMARRMTSMAPDMTGDDTPEFNFEDLFGDPARHQISRAQASGRANSPPRVAL